MNSCDVKEYFNIDNNGKKIMNDIIDLSNKNLRAYELIKIAKTVTIDSSINIKTIKLGSNCLSDDGAKVIAKILANDTNIENLDLGFNDIGDEGIILIADSLKKNQSLRVLYLSGNRISNLGFKSLSDSLSVNNGIRALHLSGNLCGFEGAFSLANALKDNSHMHTLCLNGNNITSIGAFHLSQSLLSNNSITHLNLSDNNIGDEGLLHLSSALQFQRRLQVLELSFNEITEFGLRSLCGSLKGHPCNKLLLDNNKIQDCGAINLASVLDKTSLRHLSVAFNGINTNGLLSIVQKLYPAEDINFDSTITCLDWLDLRGNSLSHEVISALASMLSKNFTLKCLYIDSKCLSETSIIELTVGIASNYKPSLVSFEGFLLGPALVNHINFPILLLTLSNEAVLEYLKEAWSDGVAHRLLLAFETRRSSKSTSPESAADIDYLSEILRSSGRSWNGHKTSLKIDSVSSDVLQFEIDVISSRNDININTRHSISELNCSPSFECMQTIKNIDSSILTKRILSNSQNYSDELGEYINSLKEIILLPYDATALWELYQYYFSPPNFSSQKDFKRKFNNIDTDTVNSNSTSSDDESSSYSNKRRMVQDGIGSLLSPNKKQKNKQIVTRIGYYPKLKQQLEIYKSESNDIKTLTLLRQLRLLEEEYDEEQQGVPIESVILNLI